MNETEYTPEIDPHIYGQLIFYKYRKAIHVTGKTFQ